MTSQSAEGPPAGVEVLLVREAGRPGLSAKGYCAVQIWTRNHVYDLDWSLQCFRVTDRAGEKPLPGHHLLGAFLSGGQRHEGERLELSHPFPHPGVEAVFHVKGEKGGYVTTSEVLRVILRLRVFDVDPGPDGIWDRFETALRPVES